MTYYLDLFSGIGGFALGAYWAGLRFNGHYFSEVDKYATKLYNQRFPDAIGLGDITKIDGATLPTGDWIISGGFPCQDISVAGKGAGLAGSRSGLWFEYARLIKEIQPRFVVIENVGALARRGLDSVLRSLAEIGYDAEWQDIRASDVGAPHRRERLWIVAYPMRDGRNEWRAEREGFGGRASSIGTSMVNPDRERREKQLDGLTARTRDADGQPCGKALADTSNGGNVRRDGELGTTQGEVRQPGRSPENGRGEWWKFEPAVCELADGLPNQLDGYHGRTVAKMADRVNRLKCLGNSIVPQIAELIFSQDVFNEWRS